MKHDSLVNRIDDETGTKTVSMLMMGNERTSFTYVLACATNNDKLKEMILFKSKTLPKRNGWMCKKIMHK